MHRERRRRPASCLLAGLGFEDCAASVVSIDSSQLSANQSFILEHEAAEPNIWRFYNFNLDADDYEVVINVAEEGQHRGATRAQWPQALLSRARMRRPQGRTWFAAGVPAHRLPCMHATRPAGALDVFAKAGVPPGSGVRQYDLSASWNQVLGSKQLEVTLHRGDPQFRTGAWFVGVVGDYEPSAFTISIHKYDCGNNCSGHGQCLHGDAPEDRRCECLEG